MKILICDAHRVFADALESLLKAAGHEVVGTVLNLDQAAEILAAEPVEVCIVDLRPPHTGKRPDIEGAARSARDTVFIALSASTDAATLRHATASGVRGLAMKGDDFGEFLRVVTEAVDGGQGPKFRRSEPVILSRSARAALRAGSGLAGGPSQFLTEREWEALGRLVRGESTASMARGMGVRISTARTHIDAVLSKLGAHSRLEAVAYAVREGLVDTSGWQREQQKREQQKAVGL